MAHRKAHFEAQLIDTNKALEARVKLLAERKLDEKQQKKDPIYRSLVAQASVFKNRIKAIDNMLELNVQTEQRKAERLAQPKQPKEKKQKVVAAPAKGKGKGEGKKPKA